MATTYFKIEKTAINGKPDKFFPEAETLTLTRFARGYQDSKPVPSGVQITIGTCFFCLSPEQAYELSKQVIMPYEHSEEIKAIDLD